MFYGYNNEQLICGSPDRNTVIELAHDLGYDDIEITTEEKPKIIPLDEIKSAKISEFKQTRDAEEMSPVEYNNYLWDFDDLAQKRINGAIIALKDGGALTWTSADNEEIYGVDAEVLQNVVKAAAVRSDELHTKYRKLKEQVNACETAEEVEKITWNIIEEDVVEDVVESEEDITENTENVK